MDRTEFKKRMKSLKSYREQNPGKGYWDWRNNLPDNLKYTDDLEYDMRGAYESGAQPKLEDDGLYHLPSRDPKSGRILKASTHPTYWKALEYDSKMGYNPYFINNTTYTWNDKDGPFIPWQQVEQFEEGGILLPEIEVLGTYPRKQYVYDRANSSQANFIQRAKDINRNTILDWEMHNAVATHKLSYAEDGGKYIVYPEVQEINGNLYDFTDPKNGHYRNRKYRWKAALDSAINRGDTLTFDRESDAKYFTEHYKEYYPSFEEGGEVPPDNSPVRVNPITNRPLANGSIQSIFNLEDAANLTPIGDVLSIRDAYIAARNKDLLGLGLAGLRAIPFIPRLGRKKISKVDRPSIPEVNPNYFQEQMQKMEESMNKRKQLIDDFYNQQDQVYESLIENEDAFRRAANADATAGTNYVGTYGDYLKQYSEGSSRRNDNLPQIRLTDNIPSNTKAQVDPTNLDWIFVNSRYSDPNEIDPIFRSLNPGLVRHELGHIIDEKSGLEYVRKLGKRSKFESEDKLKEMYPKSYKRIQDYLLNGSEIKSHMNEFREFLFKNGDYSPKETVETIRQKLDKYGSSFRNLNILFDAYKNKSQFVRDYNGIPITSTDRDKLSV